ncbi:hypothetical protein LMIY3S_04211 [Labrys miyagiensis]
MNAGFGAERARKKCRPGDRHLGCKLPGKEGGRLESRRFRAYLFIIGRFSPCSFAQSIAIW